MPGIPRELVVDASGFGFGSDFVATHLWRALLVDGR